MERRALGEGRHHLVLRVTPELRDAFPALRAQQRIRLFLCPRIDQVRAFTSAQEQRVRFPDVDRQQRQLRFPAGFRSYAGNQQGKDKNHHKDHLFHPAPPSCRFM